MGNKKPSLTKQIGEVLQTEDKREQLERVQNLLRVAEDVPIVVSVLAVRGQLFVSVNSPVQVSSSQAKGVLTGAIDQLTRLEVKEEFRAQQDATVDPLDEQKTALEEE